MIPQRSLAREGEVDTNLQDIKCTVAVGSNTQVVPTWTPHMFRLQCQDRAWMSTDQLTLVTPSWLFGFGFEPLVDIEGKWEATPCNIFDSIRQATNWREADSWSFKDSTEGLLVEIEDAPGLGFRSNCSAACDREALKRPCTVEKQRKMCRPCVFCFFSRGCFYTYDLTS